MAIPRPSQTNVDAASLNYRPTYPPPCIQKNLVEISSRPTPSPPQTYNSSIPSPYRPAQPQSLTRNSSMQIGYRPTHPPPPPPNHTYLRPQVPPSHTYYGPALLNHSYAQTQTQFYPGGSYSLDNISPAANFNSNHLPKKPSFPPPTRENLIAFRNEAMQSEDPHLQLEYVKFLLEAVRQIQVNERDPQRANKLREGMLLEAQKITKKLASHSGMGKQGYPEAQFFLANQYGTGGMGLSVDTEKAFSLYIQGSKQNHPGCTFRAAVCYEVGAGTKRDKAHAIQFYRKAAHLSDPIAMYKLGVILLKGLLHQTKNPREGISWLKRAAQEADEKHPQALHELGLAYEKEGVPSVIPDPSYAHELFTQAAQYGYAPSQFKLGQAYENGLLNCPIDPRQSITWYSKAAEKGEVEAEFALSGWYLTGADGILPQNDNEAYLWARKAADRGFAKAEYAVGYYTETGTGTRQNLEEAKRWYLRAAAQNYNRAVQRLAELKRGNSRPQPRRKHTREDAKNKDTECIIM